MYVQNLNLLSATNYNSRKEKGNEFTLIIEIQILVRFSSNNNFLL